MTTTPRSPERQAFVEAAPRRELPRSKQRQRLPSWLKRSLDPQRSTERTNQVLREHGPLLAGYRPDPPEIGVLFAPQSYYLHWAQDGQDYALRLSGPFGQGTVELSGDERRVVLRSGAGPASTAAEPQALLQREFGWSVPIGGLRYWVRGIPDPAHAIEALHLDAGGRLAALEQSGWHVKVLRWVKAGRYELPEKLFLRSEQAQVRLAVTRWTVF